TPATAAITRSTSAPCRPPTPSRTGGRCSTAAANTWHGHRMGWCQSPMCDARNRLSRESTGRMASTMESTPLCRVQRAESIAARTYRELRNALVRQAIAPGQRLVEADLAQQLGVSRTPVREALARLVAEGMLVVLPSG